MVANVTKASLSPSQQKLLTEMQRINYGRIEGLSVQHGQPVMDPLPRIFREIKFPGENGPRPESGKADFTLKAQVRDLFAHLEAFGEGVIACIEIQRGLPFRMTVEEVTRCGTRIWDSRRDSSPGSRMDACRNAGPEISSCLAYPKARERAQL